MGFFQTYDCRGKYGVDATEENCFRLGAACVKYHEAVVGMDYRSHNGTLAGAFLSGFGGDVLFAGFTPSPLVGYNCHDLGVSFTASHNPPEYNGVKFKKQQRCFFEEELIELKAEYEKASKKTTAQKKLPPKDEALEKTYTDTLPEARGGIFDLAGGAACALKKIFPKTIFGEPDPTFAKHSPEPKEGTLGALQAETLKQTSVGFAFDGDADRCVVVDGGKVIDGGILAAYIASNHLPKKSKVLVTLDTQAEVFRFLQNQGFEVEYTPVGDVYILKRMFETNADFGAERSGHYSFRGHMPDSDGIYTAALLSSAKAGQIAEFATRQFKNISLKSEVLFAVDFAKLAEWAQGKANRVDMMDGVKAEMDGYVFLVRSSKTEPKVRVNVEAESAEKAKGGLGEVEAVLKKCKVD